MDTSHETSRDDRANASIKQTIIKEEHSISIPVAVFSVVSVTIGAGMVAVPKSTYESGIPWAIGYNIFNYFCCIFSIHCYLSWGMVTGIYSIPHLGYEWFGHCSLYFVNFVQFIGFGLLPIAYYIIFAGLLKSILVKIPYIDENPDFFVGTQWFSVLVLGVLVLPLIIKKKIQELKIAGMMLFSGVIIFITLMFVLRIFSHDKGITYHDDDSEKFYRLEFDKEFLSSLSTAFVAYGFQTAFFPIYNSLKVKNYRNGMKFTMLGMGFCFVIYMCIMFVSLYTFGIEIKGDVLQNVEEVDEWESYVLRAIFLLVMATHTPFIFFIGKESLLALFALVYLRNAERRKRIEDKSVDDVIFEEDESNLNESDDGSNSPDEKKRLIAKKKLGEVYNKSYALKSLDLSQRIICSSVDRQMSMAIPFYTKSMKSIVVFSADPLDQLKTASDVLPSWLYYTITLTLYAWVVGASWAIKDVEPVIKFIGSMANAMLHFTMPGTFYFIIMRKYNVLGQQQWKAYLGLALAIYGLVMGIGWTAINVWTTISPIEHDE